MVTLLDSAQVCLRSNPHFPSNCENIGRQLEVLMAAQADLVAFCQNQDLEFRQIYRQHILVALDCSLAESLPDENLVTGRQNRANGSISTLAGVTLDI